jgi:glycosyltransferase involved in cell wall biosynthesis
VQALRENFSDFEIEIIDIVSLIKKRRDIILANGLFMLKEYGADILLGRKKIRECFFGTTYIFKTIRALLLKQLSKQEYTFTFQMQSLFDASTQGVPHFVYTDHTLLATLDYGDDHRHKVYSKAWIELEKTIYGNATRIFTRSSNITRSLIEQYSCSLEQVVCVYAGSNVELNGDGRLNNQNYSNKNILFVGIDWERKGGPVLVEAFKRVVKVQPEAQLTIVGCTPQVDVPNCRIIGRVPLQEVGPYYQQASVFCLPTRLEPFGIVFVEAMSYKLPVVATNIGAIPDFIINGENGYLVEPNQVEALAEALLGLIENPQKCKSFGEQGYRIAMDRYTWGKVGMKMKENIVAAINRKEEVVYY